MASIADVAALAGVSVTTVSHTLSGKRKVSDTVRTRVRDAMEQLGYVPSRSAQSLASGRTRILGLVVPDISNGYFAELAKGVEHTAMEQGYNVILCTTGFDHARELSYLEMIRSRAVDGIVYAAGAPPSVQQLVQVLGDLPVVQVDEEVRDAPMPAFVSDNEEGGRCAASFLLDLGHRSTLVVAGPEELESSQQRVAGFTTKWLAGGGEEPEIIDGGFTEEGGSAVVEQHLRAIADGAITCVFAVNDLMALGILDALRDAGIDCPGAVSIVGFDDIGAARFARPRLTTVRQDVAALGVAATTALTEALEAAVLIPPIRHVTPVELIVRDSTGPAPTRPIPKKV